METFYYYLQEYPLNKDYMIDIGMDGLKLLMKNILKQLMNLKKVNNSLS